MKLRLGCTSVFAVFLSTSLIACGGTGDSPSSPDIRTGPMVITGGGSDQYREPGQDNSIEAFGREGGRAELEQAATRVHAYLVARAEEDWRQACSLVSEAMKEDLRELAVEKGERCPETLSEISAPPIGSNPYQATTIKAGSIRVEGDQGYLFFNANTPLEAKLIMFREDGIWKPGGIVPSSVH